MLKRIFLGLLAGFFLLGVSPTIKANGAVRRRSAQANFVANELLVKFKAGTPAYVRGEIHRGAAATVVGRFSSDARLEHVRLPAGENLDSAIAYYSTRADVQYVQKNYIYHMMATPNDELYSGQWALAAVNAPTAWDKTTGRFSVVVAEIDTGVDYTHPDLGLNIWTNPAEAGLKCSDGVDNDPANNVDGLIFTDDCRGWNFYDNTNDPMDLNGHGTQMAGVIGAMGNDHIGIAGADWDLQIMPLKATGADGNMSTAVAIQALDYSIAHGAKLVNYSFGAPQGTGAFDSAFLDAIGRSVAAGQLFITAAGNQSSDNDATPFFPCDFTQFGATNIICVAATDENDALTGTSNYGATTVQLGAPGANILTTSLTSLNQPYIVSSGGTSFSAAYVTGGAALLKACKASLTSTDIRNILLNPANTTYDGTLDGKTVTKGVVDYAAALGDSSVGTCDSTATTSTPLADAGGPYNANIKRPVQFDGTGSTDTTGQLLLYFWSFGDGTFGAGPKVAHTYSTRGAFTATLFVRDNQGVVSSQATTVNIRPNNGH